MGQTGITDKVLKFLDATTPNEYTPKEIAIETHSPISAVKKCLQRLAANEKIVKCYRGCYRGILSPERMIAAEHAAIKMHGIKIELTPRTFRTENGQFVPEEVEGISLCPLFHGEKPVYTDDIQTTYAIGWEGRAITVTLYNNHPLVGIWLKCSNEPLDYPAFRAWTAWLEGRFGTFWTLGSPELVQVGLNRDYTELRLDGIKSAKLQSWANAWQQLYQKADRILRHEVHLSTRIALPEAMEILRSSADVPRPPPPPDPWIGMYQ
jgi:hypothetical protein